MLRYALLLCLSFLSSMLFGQSEEIGGIVNNYARVLSVGPDRVVLNDPSSFFSNDLTLLIQMSGTQINQTNSSDYGTITDYRQAGNYQFLRIDQVNGNEILFTEVIASDFEPDGLVQLVRVPEFAGDVTVTSELTASNWNGETGGVLALFVAGGITLFADVNVSGKGFTGGTACENPDGQCGTGYFDYAYPLSSGVAGEKGGGIAVRQAGQESGRGRYANGGGGGNKHNSSGGGGGNISAGGRGGIQAGFCAPDSVGGLGGQAVDINGGKKIFMGGGGGASDYNNAVGSFGGNGGGIAIISAQRIIGNGRSIRSDGIKPPTIANNIGDGAGGGGAGGSVLLNVLDFNGVPLSVSADGGWGGDQNTTWPACFASGGGGGAGLVWLATNEQPAEMSVSTEAGMAGIDVNPLSECSGGSFGATDGEVADGLIFNLELNTVVSNTPDPAKKIEYVFRYDGRQFNLYFSGERALNVRLFDTAGRLLSNFSVYDGQPKDLSQLAAGVYWVLISNGTTTKTEKIVRM